VVTAVHISVIVEMTVLCSVFYIFDSRVGVVELLRYHPFDVNGDTLSMMCVVNAVLQWSVVDMLYHALYCNTISGGDIQVGFIK